MSLKKGKVTAVCISEKKGTCKTSIHKSEFICEYGLRNDAHAGKWHRQVSILAQENIEQFKEKHGDIPDGAFGENLIIAGIRFEELKIGSLLKCNDVLLQVTQFGKECHTKCAISKQVGTCIMPIYGIFARVLSGGFIEEGDEISIEEIYTSAVITLSDRAATGEREDESGPIIAKMLREEGYFVQEETVIPDDGALLKSKLLEFTDEKYINLILTTGGTGFAPRDITPEVTLEVGERNVPGIAEYIRMISMEKTANAMLSRGVAVLRGKTLIINLPGSPKAIKEALPVFLPVLKHGIGIASGLKLDK